MSAGSAAVREAGDECGVDALGDAVRGGEDQVAVLRVEHARGTRMQITRAEKQRADPRVRRHGGGGHLRRRRCLARRVRVSGGAALPQPTVNASSPITSTADTRMAT